jgi:hypothetical protein
LKYGTRPKNYDGVLACDKHRPADRSNTIHIDISAPKNSPSAEQNNQEKYRQEGDNQ